MYNQILTQIQKQNTLQKNQNKAVKFNAKDLQLLFQECCHKYSVLQSMQKQKNQLLNMKNNKNTISLEIGQQHSVDQHSIKRPNTQKRIKQKHKYNADQSQISVIKQVNQQFSPQLLQKPTKKQAKHMKRLQKFIQENKQISNIKQRESFNNQSQQKYYVKNQNSSPSFVNLQKDKQIKKKSQTISAFSQKLVPSKQLFTLSSNVSLKQESKKQTHPQVVENARTRRIKRKCPIKKCKSYIFSQIGYFNHMIEFHPSFNPWIEEAQDNYMRRQTYQQKNGDEQINGNINQIQMKTKKSRYVPHFLILNIDEV